MSLSGMYRKWEFGLGLGAGAVLREVQYCPPAFPEIDQAFP